MSAKISPFQLLCLLLCGRMFSLLLWSPSTQEAGSALASVLLSPVVQFAVIIAVLWALRRLGARGGGAWRAADKIASAAGLLLFAWSVLWSAASCAAFVSDGFYNGRRKLLLLLLMMAAGVFAAFQGLEGMARTAPIILLLTAGGLLMLGVGAAGSMHLAYLPPLTLTAEEAFGLSVQSGMANTELAALLFLQPQATKPLRKGAIAAWLAAGAVLSAAIILAVLLCLGGYAETVPSPILAVAQCAGLSVFPHLDPALMGIIILLGFVRASLYCFLSALLWRKLFGKRRRAGRTRGGAAVSLLLCLSLLSGCGRAEESIGAKTIVTMLEVEYSPRCVVRAEYRMVGSGEKEAEYGIYSGEGDSFALALAAIERKESVRLFTESCGTVAIHKVGGEEKTTALLEEINACGKIRPMTAMFLCDGRLLCEEREGGASMGRGLEKLFVKNGGMLEEKYTLKDSIACGRELRLALTLPVVVPNPRGDGVWFVNFENFSTKNLC